MKYRVLGSVAAAAAIAFAQPVGYLAQEAGKAAGILAAARKAIGGGKLDSLKTFTAQCQAQRNVGGMQLDSDVEVYLELPDKYARVENMNGGPGMMISGGGTTGFNGPQLLQKIGAAAPGGGMVIRMGGGGPLPSSPAEKPTPEQLEQMKAVALRSAKTEVSRLMLGWFAGAHPAAQVDYTYLGDAESVEGKAYVIDVKNADGFAARLFIDQQSNLPLMVTYKAAKPRVMTQTMSAPAGGHGASTPASAVASALASASASAPASASASAPASAPAPASASASAPAPPEMADYTMYFEDWRDAGGVKFPFKMRRATEGNTVEEWSITKVTLNPKIDAKKFAVASGS